MNFGEFLGICFFFAGLIYGLAQLVDEQYPFWGGIFSILLMIVGLGIYALALKSHEQSLKILLQMLYPTFS